MNPGSPILPHVQMFRSDLARPGEHHSVKMPDLLVPTSAATPVTIGRDVYLAGGWTDEVETDKLVQVYSIDSGDCRTLPPSPQYRSKAVAIDGNIVLIGGCDSLTHEATNMMSTWMVAEERWTQALPAMKMKRNRPGVLLLQNHLCVFGGIGEDKKTCLNCFEVLDLTTKQWSVGGGRLPQPLHSPQLGVFGEYVMLYGGFTSAEPADTGSRECYKFRFQIDKDKSACRMHCVMLVHTAPSFNSALLTTSQDPVLIGGYNRAERNLTGAIHRFQISSESDLKGSWQVIGELSKPRLLPTVVAGDDRSFLVLGGASSGHPMKSLLKSVELMKICS